jgi:hypothetical protein
LRRTLRGLGLDLALSTEVRSASVDESLVREQLRLSPTERLERYEDAYAGAREFAIAAR